MTTEADGVLLVSEQAGIRLLTMNRPAVLNAVNGELARAIDEALTDLDADPSGRIGLITGRGRAFCVGADLKALSTDPNAVHIKGKGFAGIAHRTRIKPLIAAVEGPALGGGFEICLSADLVVASSTATFGLPEVLRSRLAAGGGLVGIARALPKALAMEIAMTGKPISAERALHLGFINRLTAPGTAVAAATDLAMDVLAGAPIAVRASRRIIAAAPDNDASALWKITLDELAKIRASDDSMEGINAFLERRAPLWSGW
jgi:enoyl-CoA hydratase